MTAPDCPAEEELHRLLADEASPAEIAAHVAGCAACKSRLEMLEAEMTTIQRFAAAPAVPMTATCVSPYPPQIGKYVIVGILQQAEQTTSYRGLHCLLNAEVWIDVAREPIAGGEAAIDPLVVECRRLMQIDDPGLARVRDFGLYDGRPYVVTDLPPGVRLDRMLRHGPLDADAVTRLLAHCAAAVVKLHAAGISHALLNVSSIVVRDQGGACLTDWAGAWLLTKGARAVGSHGHPSVAADTYSADVRQLAAIGYQLLTGRAVPDAAPAGTSDGCDSSEVIGTLSAAGTPPALVELLSGILCAPAREETSDSATPDATNFAAELRWIASRRRRLRKSILIACGFTLLALILTALVRQWS